MRRDVLILRDRRTVSFGSSSSRASLQAFDRNRARCQRGNRIADRNERAPCRPRWLPVRDDPRRSLSAGFHACGPARVRQDRRELPNRLRSLCGLPVGLFEFETLRAAPTRVADPGTRSCVLQTNEGLLQSSMSWKDKPVCGRSELPLWCNGVDSIMALFGAGTSKFAVLGSGHRSPRIISGGYFEF